MSDPTRLIDGSSSRMVAELLAAGRLEAPAPELVERFMRTAALGVVTGVMVEPLVSTAAELVTSPAVSTGSSAAGSAAASGTAAGSAAASGTAAGSAAAGAGGGVLVNGGAIGVGVMKSGATAAALVKSGTVVASLGKWGGMGVVALAAAAGTPRALDWVEHRRTDTAESAAARVDVLRTRQPAQRAQTEWAPAPSATAALPRLDPVEPAPVVEPGGAPRPERLERPERGAYAEPAASKLQPASPSASPAVVPPSRQPAKRASRSASKPASSTAAGPESSAGVAPIAALPAAPSTLGAELASVDRARALLARGDARQTLHELAGHERQYPKGQLQLEVTMLRMEACVQLGDLPAARDLAKRILAQPVSPLHASRARQVLEGQRSPR